MFFFIHTEGLGEVTSTVYTGRGIEKGKSTTGTERSLGSSYPVSRDKQTKHHAEAHHKCNLTSHSATQKVSSLS